MPFNLQVAVDAAIEKAVSDALAQDATADAVALAAKDAEIAQLKARIAELEAATGPVDPPPVDPPPVEPPSTQSGWPSASNTGHKGTLTPSGSITITQAGRVVENLDIAGTVVISANNVTLRNCRVRTPAFAAVRVNSGITGAVIERCTIDGVGTGNAGDGGIVGLGTFRANNIFNVENGIILQNNYTPTLIVDNYIHALKASGSPHYDGIQIDGGNANVTISHNTVHVAYNQTGAVMIDNYFGRIDNIKVDNNLLVGGGYTIYVDGQFNNNPITNVVITNNHVGGGSAGPTNFNRTNPVYTGNVNDGAALVAALG